MIELARPIYDLNLKYAQRLVADLPDEQMCAQPVEGRVMNHAAFVLGHLAWVSDAIAGSLGAEPVMPAEWKELFQMGAEPLTDRSCYPSKAALLQGLEEAHARLIAAVGAATPEMLAQPAPERVRSRFATVGIMALGLMTMHEGIHLGQLSAWRRALGLPSVF